LVTQRANKGNTGTYNNIWVFPGGIVEKGEGLRTAAVRELLEETGITVEERSLCPIALWQAAVIPRTFAPPPSLPPSPLCICVLLPISILIMSYVFGMHVGSNIVLFFSKHTSKHPLPKFNSLCR
jgi:8-oxo-dGTP pyrophosphatase MutT (NUDIX family)